jgi:hypothetical protein
MVQQKYKSITRIDRPDRGHHAWYVRVLFKGTLISKHFADLKHGGKRKALKAAIEFRNQAEKELGKPRTDRRIVGCSPLNKSGVIGVRRTVKQSRAAQENRPPGNFFEVTWAPTPGQIKRAAFSIDRYGEEEAFRRACKLRERKLRQILK